MQRPNGVIDFGATIAEIQVLLCNLQWFEPDAGWSFDHPTLAPFVPLHAQSGLYAVEYGQLAELLMVLRAIHANAKERYCLRAK